VGSKVFTSDRLRTLEDACLTGLVHARPDPLTPAFVVVPGNLLALHLQRGLARATALGHANLRFLTLVDFAELLIGTKLLRAGKRAVTPLLEELILRKAIREAVPAAGYFDQAKDHPAFRRSIHSTLTDMREALIEPGELESWAARFAAPKEGGHKLRELAGIYSRYREHLREATLFDRNDLLDESASAQDLLPDSILFFYGFYDFNPLQRKLIEALVKSREALFFFPWIDGPAFDYALPTLTWLKNLGCEHVRLENEAIEGTESALRKISRPIFSPFRRPPDEEIAEGDIELLSAPGEGREAAEIARRCLRWVKERGFKFSEIGILLRSAEPYAALLAETFSHAGIPFYLHGGTALWETREGQSLRLIFKVVREDFSRTSVVEFLTFAPLSFERILGRKASHANPALWDLLSLQAGIVRGIEEWQTRLPRLLSRAREEGESIEALIHFMELFLRLVEKLPRRGSWSELASNLAGLLGELFIPSASMQKIADEIENLSIHDFLEEEIELGLFFQAVESSLTSAREQVGSFGREGVFIGDLMSARGIPFKGVIVPGMVERLFPLMHRQDPVLLDRERQYLSETLKKELPQKEQGFDEERLLFSLTLMGAQERILLSFPRLEPFTARERIPSFFLLRLMEAVVGRAGDFSDFEQWRLLERVPLSRLFPHSTSESSTALEYDLNQANAALEARSLAPLDYLSELSPFFPRSLQAEASRWGERTFTEFDGVLKGRQALAKLDRLFGGERVSFSPTSLETYARCPYRYFIESHLRLRRLEETDPLDAISPQDRGSLVHEALYLFFSRLKEEKKLPLAAQERAYLESLMEQTAQAVFATFEVEKPTGYPLLWTLEKARIMEALRDFIAAELNDREGFVPTYFEENFECVFPLTPERVITLSGRIDRIDLSADRLSARIVDYKTGKLEAFEDGAFRGGEALQLPVYLYAAGQRLSGAKPCSAAYYHVSPRSRLRRVLFTTEEWETKLKTLQRILRELTRGIRRGFYPATPASCGSCRYPLICGHAAQMLYERKSEDPRLRFLERVKEIP
jgi:ATP-dependent helicase/DNAse subunit B